MHESKLEGAREQTRGIHGKSQFDAAYNFFAICYQTFCFDGNRFGVTIDT
jgi:hypothetical protein